MHGDTQPLLNISREKQEWVWENFDKFHLNSHTKSCAVASPFAPPIAMKHV